MPRDVDDNVYISSKTCEKNSYVVLLFETVPYIVAWVQMVDVGSDKWEEITAKITVIITIII